MILTKNHWKDCPVAILYATKTCYIFFIAPTQRFIWYSVFHIFFMFCYVHFKIKMKCTGDSFVLVYSAWIQQKNPAQQKRKLNQSFFPYRKLILLLLSSMNTFRCCFTLHFFLWWYFHLNSLSITIPFPINYYKNNIDIYVLYWVCCWCFILFAFSSATF